MNPTRSWCKIHGGSPVVVLSKRLRRLCVDGGVTIQRFLAAGLIDELTITTIPVLLGASRPLFARLRADLEFEHLSTRAFDFGFVQSTYRVAGART